MKKIIITFVLVCCALTTFSQRRNVDYLPTFDERKLHYGFYLGLNQNDFKIDYRLSNYPNAEIRVEPTIGFNVGLIGDLRLHKNINLRFEPGFISNSRKLYFTHINSETDSVREAKSTYLHLPLVLKFSTNRWRNMRPYVLAGISYDHNFSSNENNQDDNSSGQFRMKTSNFMYEVGVGVDFYLYFFKFSPSIRGVFAMNIELVDDNIPNSQWTSPVNAFGTRGIFINLAFE